MSVPTVPGMKGASPHPNPSAMKCAGCDTRKRTSGAGEVVVAWPIDLYRLAVGTEEAHALAAPHLADAGEMHAEHVLQVVDALARVRVRGEAQLVVVAAGDDRRESGAGLHVLHRDARERNPRELDGRADARKPADVAEVREQPIGNVDRAGREGAQRLAELHAAGLLVQVHFSLALGLLVVRC